MWMHQFWFDLCLATLSFTTELQTAAFKHLIPTKHTTIILMFEIHNMIIRFMEPFSSPWGLWWDSSQSLTFAPPLGWKLKDKISVSLLIWYYSVVHSNVMFNILNILGQLQQISQIYHTQVIRMFWAAKQKKKKCQQQFLILLHRLNYYVLQDYLASFVPDVLS